MTDWPDDWFRDEATRTGTAQPGAVQAGAAQPGAVQPGAAQPGAVQPGAGLPRETAEPTVQLPARGAAPYVPPAGPPPGPAWPEQPPPRTGGRPPLMAGGWRRWLRPKPIAAVLAVLLCVALIGSIGLYFYLDSQLTKVSALVPSPPTAGQNWLIAGSTGRLSARQVFSYHAGFDHDALSDTILVLHVPANGGRPTLVSIPRDSYVSIPGHGQNKINASYVFGGPSLLVRTVQDATGLHIDHFLQITYTGLVSVVNAVGGVTVCLPGPVNDPRAGIHLHKGCHTLGGRQALGFVRTRQFALGDLQRVQDQRILIKALLVKMTSFGTLINPFALFPAASDSAKAVTVDSGTSLYQLIRVAFALRSPVTTTVPFGGFASNAAGSVVLWDTAKAHTMFYDLAHDIALPRSLISGSKASATA